MMRVAILGCGYVGLELGRQLAAAGHDPVGVRRSADGVERIEAAGFHGVQADVTDRDAVDALPDADALVFAASTGGGDAAAAREVLVGGLETVAASYGDRDDSPETLVYTSSTGVYGDHDGEWVDEETPTDPTTPKTRALLDAERTARDAASARGMDATVVRFAGLYGPDRYRLTRYLDGPVTEGYLNMLHRDDAAGVVRFALTAADASAADLLLAVDDEPVSKWAFADWLAAECGRPSPPKRTVEERLAAGDLSDAAERRLRTSKRCSNRRLRDLGYEFAYPTYREGYRAAIRATCEDGDDSGRE